VSKETLFVSFSGGRTSAYMCWWLLNNKADEYDFIFIFANTGLEHEKTLEFVDKCDKEWGLNLVWVEAIINPIKNKGTTSKVVNFETATRSDKLFRDMAAVYGVPNKSYPHCNRELKIQAVQHYKTTIGLKRNHLTAIGMRGDEIDRMSPSAEEDGLIYPLISWHITYKPEVIHWWPTQSFDLEIKEHYGNCLSCWKKSDRKLFTLAQDDPKLFDSFMAIEKDFGHVNAPDNDRVFFRKHRSAEDILIASDGDFVRFEDYKPELQLRLISDGCFDINELDKEDSCGASCEAH
jgi:hypothetical protein